MNHNYALFCELRTEQIAISLAKARHSPRGNKPPMQCTIPRQANSWLRKVKGGQNCKLDKQSKVILYFCDE